MFRHLCSLEKQLRNPGLPQSFIPWPPGSHECFKVSKEGRRIPQIIVGRCWLLSLPIRALISFREEREESVVRVIIPQVGNCEDYHSNHAFQNKGRNQGSLHKSNAFKVKSGLLALRSRAKSWYYIFIYPYRYIPSYNLRTSEDKQYFFVSCLRDHQTRIDGGRVDLLFIYFINKSIDKSNLSAVKYVFWSYSYVDADVLLLRYVEPDSIIHLNRLWMILLFFLEFEHDLYLRQWEKIELCASQPAWWDL